jgi:hypothetical protein
MVCVTRYSFHFWRQDKLLLRNNRFGRTYLESQYHFEIYGPSNGRQVRGERIGQALYFTQIISGDEKLTGT